jgi:uncharacterized protein
LARSWDGQLPEVLSIAASGRVNTSILEAAMLRVAESRFGNKADAEAYPALWDILTHNPPRVTGVTTGSPLLQAELSPRNVLDVVARLASSYLVIQGPPGTGKTYTGARVILGLLQQGKRIGVCATSHKAVANLLNAVTEAAKEIGITFNGARKSDGEAALDDNQFITDLKNSQDTTNLNYQLIGGTAWVFAREDADQTYDYLFIDEAGQVSLANLMAMGTSAKNIVLLGDQMQLGQPLQGTHPGDSGLSALEYLLRDHATVPPEQGILLNVSRRMHPGVCHFISKAVYEGRLTNFHATKNQRLVLAQEADRTIRENGIVFDSLPHSGCAQTSLPEAKRINELIGSLLQQRFIDQGDNDHPLQANNILVVAPYNAQVSLLREVLPDDIAVGTVDKFQGQEAEVVIVSMTTSSGEEMPRNMEFLFDRHRLNVAISRAKTLAIVVASPGLLEIDCSTPEQMALVNTLCWVAELGDLKKEAATCP